MCYKELIHRHIWIEYLIFRENIFQSNLDILKCRLIKLVQRRKSREYLLFFINTYRKSV